MDGIGLLSIFSDVNAAGFGLQSLEKAAGNFMQICTSICRSERFTT